MSTTETSVSGIFQCYRYPSATLRDLSLIVPQYKRIKRSLLHTFLYVHIVSSNIYIHILYVNIIRMKEIIAAIIYASWRVHSNNSTQFFFFILLFSSIQYLSIVFFLSRSLCRFVSSILMHIHHVLFFFLSLPRDKIIKNGEKF